MSVQMGDGVLINTGSGYVMRDGVVYAIPDYVKSNVVTTVNKSVYVGGYELTKQGEWKRTIKAFYYCYIY